MHLRSVELRRAMFTARYTERMRLGYVKVAMTPHTQ